jgi:hypothetical protein
MRLRVLICYIKLLRARCYAYTTWTNTAIYANHITQTRHLPVKIFNERASGARYRTNLVEIPSILEIRRGNLQRIHMERKTRKR